jgi:hypothetical protein
VTTVGRNRFWAHRHPMEALQTNVRETRWLTLVSVTVAIGVLAGLGGMAVGCCCISSSTSPTEVYKP